MTRCTLSSTSSNYSLLVRQYMHAPQGLKSSLFHSQSCQTVENGLTHTPTPPHPPELTLTKTRTQAHKYTHRDILYTVRPLPTCPVALVLLACTRATGHIALCILYRYLTQASICLLSICVQDCPLMLPFNCMCTLLCTFAVNVL